MITVAIIEDNRLVREGMADMLNELPDVRVVLAATSLEAEVLKEKNPRVVLLTSACRIKTIASSLPRLCRRDGELPVSRLDLLPPTRNRRVLHAASPFHSEGRDFDDLLEPSDP